MNDKDHLVGQLTNSNVDGCKAFAKTEANIDPRSVCGEVADSTMLATFATNRLGLAEQRSSYTEPVAGISDADQKIIYVGQFKSE